MRNKQRLAVGFGVILGLLGALQDSTAMSQSVYRSTLIPAGQIKYDVSLEVQTPHIPWAKPLVGPPIKALFIGPTYAQRETAEVAQRLSLDYDTLFTGTNNTWGQPYLVEGHTLIEQVQNELRQKLQKPHDCILIGNFEWSLLPDDVVETIGRSISNGTGLIYVMYGQTFPPALLKLFKAESTPPDFDAVVPIRALRELRDPDGRPALQSLPEIRHFTFGKGRLTLIRYPGYPPDGLQYLTPDPNDALAYDYCQALLIKNILYTANHPAPLMVRSVTVPEQIDLNTVEGTPIQVTLSESAENISAHWTIRDIRGDVVAQGSEPVRQLKLPKAPEGLHFVDVTLREGDKILDWGSAAFHVISPISVGQIEFLNDILPVGGALNGQVMITGTSSAQVLPEGASLRLKLFDNFGRLYSQATLPNKEFVTKLGTFAQSSYLWFSLPVADSLTTINQARAELWQNGRLISVRQREFYVPRHPDDDFVVGVWGVSERLRRWSHIAGLLMDREHQIGVDAELVGHFYLDPAEKLLDVAGITRGNLSVYPYVERISYFERDLVRNPCLTDPAYLARRMAEHQNWAQSLRKYGCIAFNLGDEINLSAQGVDVCFSPSCQEDYRQWLQKAYGSIEKLNESWASQYTSWDQIHPITRADAAKTGNMAPWLDHRLHMTDVMMNYLDRVAGVYASQIPGARSGPEGIWGTDPYYAVDWGQLAARLQVVIPYMNETLAFTSAGSLSRPGSLSGTWMGAYPHRSIYEGMARYDPWYALLHGLNSAWFYASYDGTTTLHPYAGIAPDLRLNQSAEWFFEETQKIKNGVGKLLLNSQRQRDGIAILYSSPSAYLQPTTASDLILALRDAGYQCDIITIPQLIEGQLSRFRVLVLPTAIAMSKAEVHAVRSFVESGGVVIADVLPATHTEHGKKLDQSALADLFELPRDAGGTSQATGSRAQIDPTLGVDVTEGKSAASKPAETAVGAGQATTIRRVGAGRAVLLNLSLTVYDVDRQHSRHPEVAGYFHNLLESLSIPPALKLESTDGPLPIQGLELIRHAFAGGELLAVFREDLAVGENQPRHIAIHLPRAAFVVDLQTSKKLGQVDVLSVTSTIGAPRLFALLDREPGELTVSATSPRRGEELALDIHVRNLSSGACHVELLRPDGSVAAAYTRNILLKDGAAVFRQKPALNDPAGQWTARVTDVLTGRRIDTAFKVVE